MNLSFVNPKQEIVMSENMYKFDIPKHHKSIIKVIGVGGGGSNAVNHMYNQGIKDVEFIVSNTDSQALNGSPIPNKLQLGVTLTEGLGAGANPEVGKNAALESKEDIRELLSDDTKMVFITAGMGGGTGTGAAPVIARVAKELDILTVGIVTVPFAFEGKKKMIQAENGIQELKENCDTVLVILNDNLREIYGNLSITKAFLQADNILLTAAKGIAEIITVPGYVNVDFEDVKATMKDSGAAIMGSAETEGENRALKAAEQAISSPLLDNKDITGAEKILLSIISGEEAELQMDELSEITNFIQEKAGDDAQVIFGHGNDADLGSAIRVTVIATGFEHQQINHIEEDLTTVFDLESNKQTKLPLNGVSEKPTNTPVEHKKINYGFAGGSFEVQNQREENNNPPFTEDNNSTSGFESNQFTSSVDNDSVDKGLEDEIEERVTETLRSQGFEEKNQLQEGDENEIQYKKEMLIIEGKRRALELKSNNKDFINTENFKDLLEVPAYERKKVRLQNVPHSSEKNISRYNLDDDFHISKKNPYLHDRPD